MEEKVDPFYCGEEEEEEPSVRQENFNNRITKRRILMPTKVPEEIKQPRNALRDAIDRALGFGENMLITDEELVSTWQYCVSLHHFKSHLDLSWDALGDVLNRVQELRKHGVRLKTMNVFE